MDSGRAGVCTPARTFRTTPKVDESVEAVKRFDRGEYPVQPSSFYVAQAQSTRSGGPSPVETPRAAAARGSTGCWSAPYPAWPDRLIDLGQGGNRHTRQRSPAGRRTRSAERQSLPMLNHEPPAQNAVNAFYPVLADR